MPETIPSDSVGLVTPKTHHFSEPLELDCGQKLPNFDLVYETYGTLNQDHSNAILICHALSGDHHAAGYHSIDNRKAGWWDNAIGKGKSIDTNKFFVVCPNNLGGCKGSTGPLSHNPKTNKRFGPDFPIITVNDWVNSQAYLADMLGINKWCAVIGGSLGGMQALQWAISYPERLSHCIVIASAANLSAQNIAFNEVARQAIMTDPEFYEGHYYQHDTVPRQGLILARMLGHITYLSDDAMRHKFNRELREEKLEFGFNAEFQIESYLRYQGKKFVTQFDANTYLLMTKALDYFDPASEYDGDLEKTLAPVQAKFCVMSFTSDWRFNPSRSREIVKALLANKKNVSYIEIEASNGHDAFLMPISHYMKSFNAYMQHSVLADI